MNKKLLIAASILILIPSVALILVCKTSKSDYNIGYENGKKRGFEQALVDFEKRLSESNVFLSPLVMTNGGSVKNCMFVNLSRHGCSLYMGGSNGLVYNCTFYGFSSPAVVPKPVNLNGFTNLSTAQIVTRLMSALDGDAIGHVTNISIFDDVWVEIKGTEWDEILFLPGVHDLTNKIVIPSKTRKKSDVKWSDLPVAIQKQSPQMWTTSIGILKVFVDTNAMKRGEDGFIYSTWLIPRTNEITESVDKGLSDYYSGKRTLEEVNKTMHFDIDDSFTNTSVGDRYGIRTRGQ